MFALNKNSTRFSLLAVVLLAGGLFFAINSSQQNQEQRGRAAASSAQIQCSTTGKVQFAISFTNPETYIVDLNVYTADDTVDENYTNIGVGQTKNVIIATNKASLPNGTISFGWLPSDDNNPANGGDKSNSYTALNCGSTPTGTLSGSPSSTPSGTPSGAPSPTAVSGPTSSVSPTQASVPSGKKAAADINDDGFVNQIDYNLFLREISTQPGQ
jgi:hypothetical protein